MGHRKRDIDCIILGGVIQMSQESFFFFVWYIIIKKAPYSVIVSHKVKFSTLTIFIRPYCSFQHHLSICMRIQCQIIFVNYIRWLDANEPRKHFFFVWYLIIKSPIFCSSKSWSEIQYFNYIQ